MRRFYETSNSRSTKIHVLSHVCRYDSLFIPCRRGFASGNQANTYFVSLGWPGILSALFAMFLLTKAISESMIMFHHHRFSSHKELFEYLYEPYPKLAILFDLFFYVIVLMAIAAALSSAASALQQYLPLLCILVGAIILVFTIFGSERVRKLSTVLGIIILVLAMIIYVIGIFKSP